MKKYIIKILPIVMVMTIIISNPLFAIDAPSGTAYTEFTGALDGIWGSIAITIRTAAVLAVMLSGIRYMMASADGKADIKNQTIILIIGAILVFAVAPVLNTLQDIANNTL